MQDVWYYAGPDDTPVGPHPRAVLEARRADGELHDDTLVWTAGMESWLAYARSPLAASMPPVVFEAGAGEAAAQMAASAGWRPEAAPAAFDDPYGVPSPRRFQAADPRGAPDAAPPELAVDDDGWQSTSPRPWRRYFARMLDTILLGAAGWFVLAMVLAAIGTSSFESVFGPPSLLNNAVSKTILTLLLVVPTMAWLLGVTGSTPGKWWFGVRVTHRDGSAIGWWRALRREGRVLLQGLALGIPLFSMVAMIIAFVRLRDEGATGWDARKPWVVTYRPRSAMQTLMFTLGAVLLVLVLLVFEIATFAKKG